MRRRAFLESSVPAALVAGAAGASAAAAPGAAPAPRIVRPPRLRAGDVAGLVAPAFASYESVEIEIAQDVTRAFGLEPRLGAHVRDRHGYLAGRDEDRAADVNRFFADPSVKAVLAIQGGGGCARVLPHLDWEAIGRNPKVVAGFSDVTGLHCGLQAKAGLVSFHAPVLVSSWPRFSVEQFRRVVFEGEAVTMANPPGQEDRLVQREDRTRTITPGKARGRLVGGNLSVLTSLVGTPYLPSFDGALLFLEDVEEEIRRVDRMMTQLRLAGLLDRISGFIFGTCSKCGPGERYGSLTLEEVLDEHVKPLGVPAYEGAMIGHQARQFTVPVGIEVEVDASAGTITMLEPAVV